MHQLGSRRCGATAAGPALIRWSFPAVRMNTGRQKETEEGERADAPRPQKYLGVVFGVHFSPRLTCVCTCETEVDAAKRSLHGEKKGGKRK